MTAEPEQETIDPTEPDLQALLRQAAIVGQRLLTEWGTAGTINMGDPLYLHIGWPTAHKGEHFALVGMRPDHVSFVAGLNEKAEHRLKELGSEAGNFAAWYALLTWHQATSLMMRTEIRLEQGPGRPSGLLLPH